MTSIYDRPVRELLQTALDEMADPFTSQDTVQWFTKHYDKVNPRTVRAHLRRACVNIPPDATGATWQSADRAVYRLSPGHFTRYRPAVHGDFEQGLPVGLAEETEVDDLGDVPADAAEASFALEVHLEEFMEANWSSIDFGRSLRIWADEEGNRGRQYVTDVGVIDFLCEDETANELVVVELKRGKSSDRAVGQILRYMGWVREHTANGHSVSGIIITHEYDDRVRYAIAELPKVEAWTYQVSFTLDTKAFAV